MQEINISKTRLASLVEFGFATVKTPIGFIKLVVDQKPADTGLEEYKEYVHTKIDLIERKILNALKASYGHKRAADMFKKPANNNTPLCTSLRYLRNLKEDIEK